MKIFQLKSIIPKIKHSQEGLSKLQQAKRELANLKLVQLRLSSLKKREKMNKKMNRTSNTCGHHQVQHCMPTEREYSKKLFDKKH